MNRGTGLLTFWRHPWVALSAYALLGCMGGTGTDTENGVYVSAQVVDADSNPVRNVDISVLDLQARSDSSGNSPLYDTSAMLTTNESGRVFFFLKKNGTYMAAGKRGDSVLFIDTLRTKAPTQVPGSPGGLGNPTFMVETPVRANGKVRLNSGLVVDTGRVMLRGTKIISSLRDSGSYDLGWLPSTAQKTSVTIVYKGRDRTQRFVKVSAKGSQLTVHASPFNGPCLLDSTEAITPARTHTGSLSTKADVARVVGKSCAYRVGAKVKILEIDSVGKVLRTLGDFVIPSPTAPKIWANVVNSGLGKSASTVGAAQRAADTDSSAVPVACIESENDPAGLTGRASLGLTTREILVDDFKSGKGCLQ
jgi:hypothetical protein